MGDARNFTAIINDIVEHGIRYPNHPTRCRCVQRWVREIDSQLSHAQKMIETNERVASVFAIALSLADHKPGDPLPRKVEHKGEVPSAPLAKAHIKASEPCKKCGGYASHTDECLRSYVDDALALIKED